MSTNTNNLPDVEVLQELANQLFKALPEDAPKEISLDPYEHPRATAFAKSITGEGIVPGVNLPADELMTHGIVQPALASPVPVSGFSAPPSATGLGVSSSVAGSGASAPRENYSAFAALQPGLTPGFEQTSSDKSTLSGGVPASVAGSGASPSYVHQPENFNIKEPVTSFPDANIDKQTAGNKQDPFALPFIDEQPYWQDIESILKFVNISDPTTGSHHSPLPIITDTNTPSFYFLQQERLPVNNGELGGFTHGFDAYKIKKDFPILNEKVNGKSLVWLDNAATTQKPQSVIDRLSYFYRHENSNIHRAAHELAARATDAYEEARKKVQQFLGARSPNEIIFVRGATEAINLVAQSWGDQYLKNGDEIIVSHLEHHANIVPWKRLADKKGLTLNVIPVDDDGQILLDEYARLLNANTKLVAFTQVSNALGTVTPAEQMVAMAHAAGAKVLVDGAQSVSHMPVNVQALDADWFVFSGHKVFGPTGIGVVYGKEDLLNSTEPWQGGGNMIQDVTFEEIQYHKAPNRFEAGTGNIADAVGLGAAIDYVTQLGIANINAYEHALLEYATHHLKQVPGIRLIGTAAHKASVLSFILKGHSNDDVGKALNREGIAVRTGHHCAQPILRRMGVETTVRPSLAFYNTCEDVDRLVAVLKGLTR
ncbi:family 2A encapsulin nanocompartment cargo protein cysteine desulfurase [Agriterribacter sp.]|uniref:family 2A encapsulin nanocompartment cargo protein cysteine desulfurase n=1 Tax=Agriterribacter sp. TaxID=2821509 RepID=UPI002CB65789|nr:family 2A encapsulin nanocompartment cargo protein cysteine desulfurase [Agriterribacter sp.]HRO44791.1 family 2A encapsulin nanocompartment cargo protein cysteine desulfurase [Agriterribacter sp.]HRQ18124.1 family 2A encapsulin nanocompartment cargo protein cysteine desulfurase [Agriterribacter sp.]